MALDGGALTRGWIAIACVATVAGCFSPDIAPGLACGPGGACPPGQMCDEGSGLCVDPNDNGDADAADQSCAKYTLGYAGSVTGHCYYPEEVAGSWFGGRDSCGAEPGAHLVAYESSEEQDELAAQFAVNQWIGLTDRGTEGTYRWATGPVEPNSSWAAGEPNDDMLSVDEDCVWFEPGAGFHDAPCDSTDTVSSRVCEVEPVHVGTDSDHQYQIFYLELDQPDAAAHCQQIGGHLVTIGSQNEMDFIQSFTAGLDLWIGLSDSATEGTFEWTTGETLTFTNWETGEPGAADTAENCVYKHADGTWDDWECDRASYGALCEIE